MRPVHEHLTDGEKHRIRETAELLAERPSELTRRFYTRFFERHPEVKELFGRDSHADQSRMLHETLIGALDHLDDARWLRSTMEALGHRHRAYEVTDVMYEWFSTCLIETLADSLGDRWSPEHETAWCKVLGALSALMQSAGR